MKHLLLAVIWIVWCTVHSLLISESATVFLKKRLGDGYRFTRIAYNVLAALSLLPVLAYSRMLSGENLLQWVGAWRLVQFAMLALSLWLFAAGARQYDIQQILGIRQIREHDSERGLTSSGGIVTAGILGRVRHPWYGGAILLLWSRNLDGAALVTNLVLTAYLLIGTLLEERKLVREFGDEYVRYRMKVPMLLPRPGRGSPRCGRDSSSNNP